MSVSGRQSWLGIALLAGLLYCVIGIVSALLSNYGRGSRLAAWVLSAIVYAIHIGIERLRRRNSPYATAWHAGLAVAFGAFGLAVAANLHELLVASNYRWSLSLALVAWPLLTAMPAFVVALAAAYGLTLVRRG
ncbi:MAG: hypothetical protein ABJC10_11500 [Acidobacteriota bacterium]